MTSKAVLPMSICSQTPEVYRGIGLQGTAWSIVTDAAPAVMQKETMLLCIRFLHIVCRCTTDFFLAVSCQLLGECH